MDVEGQLQPNGPFGGTVSVRYQYFALPWPLSHPSAPPPSVGEIRGQTGHVTSSDLRRSDRSAGSRRRRSGLVSTPSRRRWPPRRRPRPARPGVAVSRLLPSVCGAPWREADGGAARRGRGCVRLSVSPAGAANVTSADLRVQTAAGAVRAAVVTSPVRPGGGSPLSCLLSDRPSLLSGLAGAWLERVTLPVPARPTGECSRRCRIFSRLPLAPFSHPFSHILLRARNATFRASGGQLA